jgi:hypothetical protein
VTLTDPTGHLQKSQRASLIEEAQILVRRCAEPRRADEGVKRSIRRVSRLLELPFSRTWDLWYGNAKRVDAGEMDRLRRVAENAKRAQAVTGLKYVGSRLLASRSSAAHQVIAGLTEALLALSGDAGEACPSREPPAGPEAVSHDIFSPRRPVPLPHG